MQTYQHIQMCLRQYVTNSLVGKFRSSVVVPGLLLFIALVATCMISVPAASAYTGTSCSGSDRAHTVVAGDTLSRIGYRYSTGWLALASYNHISDPNLIYTGQRVCIPKQETAAPEPIQSNRGAASVAVQPAPSTSVSSTNSNNSSSIPAMINQVFGVYGSGAINVARCESGLNPNAYNPSGAAGLFQIMPGTWASTAEAGQSPYNAAANIAAAYQIFVRDGYSWREWTCKP